MKTNSACYRELFPWPFRRPRPWRPSKPTVRPSTYFRTKNPRISFEIYSETGPTSPTPYLRLVRSLDARYLGSTFEQELKSYYIDGALCVLVYGPLTNLSDNFNHVVDLIAHEKAAAWLEKRKMNPCTARALLRQGLVQRLGLLVTCG